MGVIQQIKLLIIGESGAGKSSILLRFIDDSFSHSFITTIGIDFKIKTVEIDGKLIKLQIWDTAGQERFRNITNAYYRGAMGIFIVYDVTDRKSFESLNEWKRNVEKLSTKDVTVILIGNKCDMESDRKISIEEGRAKANEFNCNFFETSSKNNIGIEEAFLTMAKDIYYRTKASEEDAIQLKKENVITLSNEKSTKTSGCC
ncbi:GTP-binding protein [Clydaea vesicula]|uniref:Ras-related protein Rab-1 n=1 Tax=Clydaea vesicula TaxID=447962 RepID=A0AAD5U9H7_9FUNG|nr:GTP-binding protein [Clydaea vesicula]